MELIRPNVVNVILTLDIAGSTIEDPKSEITETAETEDNLQI